MATVSISAVVGDNGIIAKAKLAKNMQANSIQAEQDAMDELLQEYANAMAGEGSVGDTTTEPEEGSMLITSINLSETSVTMDKNESITLVVTINPDNASNKTVLWSSSNEEVATVTQNGVVTSKTAGTAIITVTAQDGSEKTATCSISVNQTVVDITTTDHDTIITEDELGNPVVIPGEFKVAEDSGKTVDEGIVITDGTNEFVWVPVSEESFDLMFKPEEALNPALKLSGSTGVTSNYYSNLRQRSEDTYTVATITNGMYSSISTSTIREPDLVVGSGGTSLDASTSTTYYSQAGFTSTAEMAQAFVDDYTNMRASIEKYDGFYIGRYELTGTIDSPTVKAGAVLTASSEQAGNWYGLYKACRDVKRNDQYVTSTMIWGCQWDETMNWLKNTKFKGNESAVESDSSSWGNYLNVSVKASDGKTEIKESGTSIPLETGITTYTMANKIYDLAGNYYEYTQEAVSNTSRSIRGGHKGINGEDYPVSSRSSNGTYSNGHTTRITLYIN